MINITRRQLLYITSFMPVTGSIFAAQLPHNDQFKVNKHAYHELLYVLALWRAHETLVPKNYLSSRKLDIENTSAIKQAAQQDFLDNNLFEVKGLVLAKSEAAAIALLAEELISDNQVFT